MSAEEIRKHFVAFLGADVGVTFPAGEDMSAVALYRPDRLSDEFVTLAFQALRETSPEVAGTIDRLLVSYETRLGRTQRGVRIGDVGSVGLAAGQAPLSRSSSASL